MKIIERRTFLALAGSSILMLAGCSSDDSVMKEPESEQDTTGEAKEPAAEKKAKEPETAQIGESVDLGNMVITIQSLDHSASYEERYRRYDKIKSTEIVLLLTFIYENVSYKGEYDDGSLNLSDFVKLKDESGATLSPMSSSYDYGVYMVAAGGYAECSEGEAIYAALGYAVPADMTGWSAVIGDTEIPLTVQETE